MNGLNLVPVPSPEPAEYLIDNWKMVQANNEWGGFDSKFIRVCNGVASITNRGLIIRSQLPFLPDGYYAIDQNNSFTKIDPYKELASYETTRDVEVLKPPFEKMDRTPELPRQDVADFIVFLNHLRQENKLHSVLICQDAAYVMHRMELWFKFPFPLPVNGDGLVFEAYNLKLAFTEMLRYDHVFVWRDNRLGPVSAMPLAIGLDWSRCALITHKRSW